MTFTADEAARGLSLWGSTVGLVGGGRAAPGFVSVRPAREVVEVGARVTEDAAPDLTGPKTSPEVLERMLNHGRLQKEDARPSGKLPIPVGPSRPTEDAPSLRELAQLKPAGGAAAGSREQSVPELSWWSKVVTAASKPSPLGGVSWGVVGAVAVGAIVAGVVVSRRGR